ncbi:MAG: serine--tRNA ligase [Candidatus Dormibacteria bacterium]
MLSLSFIREHPELVRRGAELKGYSAPVDEILELDLRHRDLLTRVEEMKAERNRTSKEIAQSRDQAAIARMRELGEAIRELDAEVTTADERLSALLLDVPNLPHESVPVGKDENDNVTVREWGVKRRFDFTPRTHYDLGEALDILDFERAAKISGSRFAILKGAGAALERALAAFMLDVHVREHGYTEVLPPFMVWPQALVGTGNLPKFADDMFSVNGGEYFLIPTAEVPVTNLYRDEILEAERLPIRHVAFTPCFRSEAGAAGKDTRGYIRVHQFQKVEMVKFVEPETSLDELESLVADAERILQLLEIPYRVLLLCTGDMGFKQQKVYDLEAWCPGLGRHLEVSSCSDFTDWQARRTNLRYRPAANEKPRHLHTLNGSGLAIARTWDAVLENYQREDGRIDVPAVLRPYLGGLEVIG